MAIPFNTVPGNLRVPFVAAEFDNSLANQGPSLLAFRALLVGQRLPSASAPANSLQRVTSADRVATICGRGSMLHRMAIAFFAMNQSTETWLLVLDDDPSAALASGSLAITGPATADGTIALYLGGVRVTVGVTSGDSASTIAAAVATAIGKHASGTITCATVQAADTATIGGVLFTAVSGAPAANQFDISGSDSAAATSLVAAVKANTTTKALVRGETLAGVATFRAVAGGTGGNAITLATSNNTRLAKSGTTLAGATADTNLAVHAHSSSASVVLHAMNAGLVANEYDVRANYADGDELPAGVGVAVTPMSGGTANPALATGIAAMGDSWYHVIASAYTDATSLASLETELASRNGAMRMIDGMMFTAKADTYSTVATLGNSRNSPHSSISRANDRPTPPHEIAAAVAGVVAFEAAKDPARPFQTLSLQGAVQPAAEIDRDTLLERNLLLFDGISTLRDADGGVVRIERLITTYKTNVAGSPDESYLDVNTMLTLMFLRYAWRTRVATKWPRHKVANDGTRFGAGQPVVTPSIVKAEAIAWFREMEELGLVENFDLFKANLLVERNISDPNRVDVVLPPDLINQLVATVTKMQFRR